MRRLGREVPQDEGEVRPGGVPRGRVGAAGGLRRRSPDLEVSIDGGDPTPSLSVMVGRTDPYTYYKDRGLRMTPEASLDTGLDVLSVRKLDRRSVPRIAWQVFGSARHVHGRDIDYVHDASHVLVTVAGAVPGAGGRRLARRPSAAWRSAGARGALGRGLAGATRTGCVDPRGFPFAGSRTPTSTGPPSARRAPARPADASACTARIRSSCSRGRRAGCAGGRAP